MGKSFVHDDTRSAVLITEGNKCLGSIVCLVSCEVVHVGDVGPLAPCCKSSLSALPDDSCLGDAVESVAGI
jgi:hypothetical protein